MTTVESLSYSVRQQVVGHYLGQLIFLVGILSIPPLLFSLIDGGSRGLCHRIRFRPYSRVERVT